MQIMYPENMSELDAIPVGNGRTDRGSAIDLKCSITNAHQHPLGPVECVADEPTHGSSSATHTGLVKDFTVPSAAANSTTDPITQGVGSLPFLIASRAYLVSQLDKIEQLPSSASMSPVAKNRLLRDIGILDAEIQKQEQGSSTPLAPSWNHRDPLIEGGASYELSNKLSSVIDTSGYKEDRMSHSTRFSLRVLERDAMKTSPLGKPSVASPANDIRTKRLEHDIEQRISWMSNGNYIDFDTIPDFSMRSSEPVIHQSDDLPFIARKNNDNSTVNRPRRSSIAQALLSSPQGPKILPVPEIVLSEATENSAPDQMSRVLRKVLGNRDDSESINPSAYTSPHFPYSMPPAQLAHSSIAGQVPVHSLCPHKYTCFQHHSQQFPYPSNNYLPYGTSPHCCICTPHDTLRSQLHSSIPKYATQLGSTYRFQPSTPSSQGVARFSVSPGEMLPMSMHSMELPASSAEEHKRLHKQELELRHASYHPAARFPEVTFTMAPNSMIQPHIHSEHLTSNFSEFAQSGTTLTSSGVYGTRIAYGDGLSSSRKDLPKSRFEELLRFAGADDLLNISLDSVNSDSPSADGKERGELGRTNSVKRRSYHAETPSKAVQTDSLEGQAPSMRTTGPVALPIEALAAGMPQQSEQKCDGIVVQSHINPLLSTKNETLLEADVPYSTNESAGSVRAVVSPSQADNFAKRDENEHPASSSQGRDDPKATLSREESGNAPESLTAPSLHPEPASTHTNTSIAKFDLTDGSCDLTAESTIIQPLVIPLLSPARREYGSTVSINEEWKEATASRGLNEAVHYPSATQTPTDLGNNVGSEQAPPVEILADGISELDNQNSFRKLLPDVFPADEIMELPLPGENSFQQDDEFSHLSQTSLRLVVGRLSGQLPPQHLSSPHVVSPAYQQSLELAESEAVYSPKRESATQGLLDDTVLHVSNENKRFVADNQIAVSTDKGATLVSNAASDDLASNGSMLGGTKLANAAVDESHPVLDDSLHVPLEPPVPADATQDVEATSQADGQVAQSSPNAAQAAQDSILLSLSTSFSVQDGEEDVDANVSDLQGNQVLESNFISPLDDNSVDYYKPAEPSASSAEEPPKQTEIAVPVESEAKSALSVDMEKVDRDAVATTHIDTEPAIPSMVETTDIERSSTPVLIFENLVPVVVLSGPKPSDKPGIVRPRRLSAEPSERSTDLASRSSPSAINSPATVPLRSSAALPAASAAPAATRSPLQSLLRGRRFSPQPVRATASVSPHGFPLLQPVTPSRVATEASVYNSPSAASFVEPLPHLTSSDQMREDKDGRDSDRCAARDSAVDAPQDVVHSPLRAFLSPKNRRDRLLQQGRGQEVETVFKAESNGGNSLGKELSASPTKVSSTADAMTKTEAKGHLREDKNPSMDYNEGVPSTSERLLATALSVGDLTNISSISVINDVQDSNQSLQLPMAFSPDKSAIGKQTQEANAATLSEGRDSHDKDTSIDAQGSEFTRFSSALESTRIGGKDRSQDQLSLSLSPILAVHKHVSISVPKGKENSLESKSPATLTVALVNASRLLPSKIPSVPSRNKDVVDKVPKKKPSSTAVSSYSAESVPEHGISNTGSDVQSLHVRDQPPELPARDTKLVGRNRNLADPTRAVPLNIVKSDEEFKGSMNVNKFASKECKSGPTSRSSVVMKLDFDSVECSTPPSGRQSPALEKVPTDSNITQVSSVPSHFELTKTTGPLAKTDAELQVAPAIEDPMTTQASIAEIETKATDMNASEKANENTVPFDTPSKRETTSAPIFTPASRRRWHAQLDSELGGGITESPIRPIAPYSMEQGIEEVSKGTFVEEVLHVPSPAFERFQPRRASPSQDDLNVYVSYAPQGEHLTRQETSTNETLPAKEVTANTDPRPLTATNTDPGLVTVARPIPCGSGARDPSAPLSSNSDPGAPTPIEEADSVSRPATASVHSHPSAQQRVRSEGLIKPVARSLSFEFDDVVELVDGNCPEKEDQVLPDDGYASPEYDLDAELGQQSAHSSRPPTSGMPDDSSEGRSAEQLHEDFFASPSDPVVTTPSPTSTTPVRNHHAASRLHEIHQAMKTNSPAPQTVNHASPSPTAPFLPPRPMLSPLRQMLHVQMMREDEKRQRRVEKHIWRQSLRRQRTFDQQSPRNVVPNERLDAPASLLLSPRDPNRIKGVYNAEIYSSPSSTGNKNTYSPRERRTESKPEDANIPLPSYSIPVIPKHELKELHSADGRAGHDNSLHVNPDAKQETSHDRVLPLTPNRSQQRFPITPQGNKVNGRFKNAIASYLHQTTSHIKTPNARKSTFRGNSTQELGQDTSTPINHPW